MITIPLTVIPYNPPIHYPAEGAYVGRGEHELGSVGAAN